MTLDLIAAGGPVGTTLDDFAFVTSVIPEPARAPCLAAAMALAPPRRRHRRPTP